MVLWVAVLLLAVLSIGIAVAEVLSPWRCPWKILEDVVGVRGPAVSMRLTSFDPRRSRGQGKKELEWVRCVLVMSDGSNDDRGVLWFEAVYRSLKWLLDTRRIASRR